MVDLSILTPETIYASWTNVSIILLTAALLFYHMTKAGTLKIDKFSAAGISIGLITVDILFNITALITYYNRSKQAINSAQSIHVNLDSEKIYRWVYFITGIIFLFIEIMICFWIVHDTLRNPSM